LASSAYNGVGRAKWLVAVAGRPADWNKPAFLVILSAAKDLEPAETLV